MYILHLYEGLHYIILLYVTKNNITNNLPNSLHYIILRYVTKNNITHTLPTSLHYIILLNVTKNNITPYQLFYITSSYCMLLKKIVLHTLCPIVCITSSYCMLLLL